MKNGRVLGVGIAVPSYHLGQQEIKQFSEELFKPHITNLDRLLSVFENGYIKTRYLSQPLHWYANKHNFADANKVFVSVAADLAVEASQQAIKQANVSTESICAIVFISSTGIATPSLDAKLIQRLGLASDTIRVPIWGLGCAGGVTGLARAAELAKVYAEKYVLLTTVELCSLTFQREDYSKSNLVGSSIFADGAAAAVISANGLGPELIDRYSTLFPDTEDIMGWDLTDSGLKVRFSRDIPSLVKKHLPGLVEQACNKWRISRQDIKYFVVHPGGAKVLSAYQESLGLRESNLEEAYSVLENYGNMSSSSVLFVLKQFLAKTPAAGRYGIMLALGPGFSAEQVLFRW